MTEDTLLPFDFPAVSRKKVTADFAADSISSDGGLVLLRAAERRLGLAEAPSRIEVTRLTAALVDILCRSCPLPALPGFPGIAGLSAALPARPAPHGVPVDACPPPTGFPVLPPSPSSMRAAVITPAETAGARIARFPADGSLPRYSTGRPPRCPFRGLLDVHSRCGPHGR